MVVYYISFGEPPRPPLWQPLLLILLVTLALAVAAAIAYGIYELASGDENISGASVPLGNVPGSLASELASRYKSETNAVILADASRSILDNGYLYGVRDALAAVARQYTEEGVGTGQVAVNSRAALVPFTEGPESSPNLAPLDVPQESSKWIKQATGLKPSDNPAYIYDAIAAAHEVLIELDDRKRVNVIVLLTDQGDGGIRVIDPTRLVPCPLDIPAEPGEVCSPVFEQIPVDLDKLVLCPAEVAAVARVLCNPVPGSADGYERINTDDLEFCPPEWGVANVLCYDNVIDYHPVDPAVVETCPPGFAKPGNFCVDVYSKTDRDELIFILANSEVNKLKVHIIGLGPDADRVSLELLAKAGGGQYIHCSSVDDCKVPE